MKDTQLEAPEIQESITPEEEKVEASHSEAAQDMISEPDPAPDPIPVAPEIQAVADPAPAPEDAPTIPEVLPTPKPAPPSAPLQTVADSQPGDMVYVPGFGWLECQGPGEVIYDENIYENGNKIGIMG